MVQERGGLDYKIIFVTDTKDAEAAKEVIKELKKSINQLRKAKAKAAVEAKKFTLSQTELGTEIRKLNSLTRSQITQAKKRGVITAREAKEQRILVRTLREKRAAIIQLASIEKSLATSRRTLNSKEIRDKKIQLEVQKRITRATLQTAVAQRLAAQGRDLRGLTAADRSAQGLNRQAKAIKSVGKEAKTAQSSVNRISFTFRRLFGILAAFAAAREGLRLIRLTFSTAVQFSAQLETAALGIAAVIAAAGDVRGASGEATSAVNRFALAQVQARQQLTLLRNDALFTAAGLEELAKAFETATGPGLQAGFNLDEIRQFTVRISQAATAIGLQQNQLAEEIRSILTGNIRARTTFIATALGITNADVRQAKEAGILVEFLEDKLEAFELAGRKALLTLGPLFTNAQIALKTLLAAGSVEFFTEIKGILLDIQDVIAPLQTSTGIRIVNPQAVAAVETIFNGVKAAIVQARILVKTLDFSKLETIGTAIGGTITAISSGLAGLISGFLDGLAIVSSIFTSIFNQLQRFGITNLFNLNNLTEAFALITQIVILLVAFRGISAVILFLWSSTVKVVKLLKTGFFALVVVLKTVRAIVAITVALFGGIPIAIAIAIGALLFFSGTLDGIINKIAQLAKFIGEKVGGVIRSALGLSDFNAELTASKKEGRALANIFDEMGISVISTRREFELTQDVVDKLEKSIRRAAAELDFEKITRGASGLLADIIQELSGATLQIEDDTLKMARERDQVTQQILNTEEELLDAQAESTSLGREFNDLILQQVNLIQAVQGEENKLRDVNLEILRAKKDILRIDAQTQANQAIAAKQNLRELEAEKVDLERQIKAGREELQIDFLPPTADLGGREVEIVATLLEKTTNLIQLEDKRRAIIKDIAFVQAANAVRVGKSIAALGVSRLSTLEDENISIKANIEVQRLQNKEVASLNRLEQNLLKAKADALLITADLDITRARLTATERTTDQFVIQLEKVRDRLQVAKDLAETDAERKKFNAEILEVEKNITEATKATTLEEANLNLELQERLLLEEAIIRAERRAQEEIDKPITIGFKRAFETIVENAKSTFEIVRDTIVGAIQGTVATISAALGDALTPDGAPIKEHFARLGRIIGQTLVTEILKAGIAQLLIQFGIGVGAGVPLGGAETAGFGIGGYRGGSIPSKAGASPAHFSRGHGLAEGGPPPGINPKDTVPIWAQPGEFMMRLAAVGKYGIGVMSALNRGLISPPAVQALVAQKSEQPKTTRLVPSYATGGGIAPPVASTQGQVPIAALMANEQQMQDMLNGGSRALDRWLLERGYSRQPQSKDVNFFR